MEPDEIRRCIDDLADSGRTPDKKLIAARLGVTATRLGEAFKDDPALNDYLLGVRAEIRSERKAQFARLQEEAIAGGDHVPFKEPQNLGRKVSPIDIAKNPRYQQEIR